MSDINFIPLKKDETNNLSQLEQAVIRTFFTLKKPFNKDDEQHNRILKRFHSDQIDRTQIINLIGINIREYFNNEYPNGNVFLLDGSWGSGKTWVTKVLENEILHQNKQNCEWISYSSWNYLSEKELFFDIWKTLNHKLIDELKTLTGDNARDEFHKLKNTTAPFIRFGGKIANLFKIEIGSIKLGLNIPKSETKEDYDNDFYDLLNYKDKKYTFNIKTPTILVIDDLDRIEKAKLWRIFMLISLFEDEKNLFILLIGSSDYLEKIIDGYYNIEGEGENFLTKFITRRFPLSSPSFTNLLLGVLGGDFVDNKTLQFCIKNLIHIHSLREFQFHYIWPLENLVQLEIWTTSDKKDSIILWFFLLTEIKLRHKSLWKNIINKQIVENIELELEKSCLNYLSLLNENIKETFQQTEINEFNKILKRLNVVAYILALCTETPFAQGGYGQNSYAANNYDNRLTNGNIAGTQAQLYLNFNQVIDIAIMNEPHANKLPISKEIKYRFLTSLIDLLS